MDENDEAPRVEQAEQMPVEQVAVNVVPSPLNGVIPPVEHRWQKGTSGNPLGRKTAGATLREWLNSFAEQDPTEAELRAIARDKSLPWTKRAAAKRILRTLESGDLADMEPLLDGRMTLEQLRESGVDTEVIKKIKVRRRTLYKGDEAEGVEVEREVELHDRSGVDVDRVIGHTELTVGEREKNKRLDEGKATENVQYQAAVIHQLPLPPHLQERAKELPPPRET